MYTDINCCNIGHTQIEISRKSVLVYFVHQFFDGVGMVLLLILDFMGEKDDMTDHRNWKIECIWFPSVGCIINFVRPMTEHSNLFGHQRTSI